MADPRTFTLIGRFDDQISPALEKINKSLDKVKVNLSSLQSVTKPLKKDFAELADVSNKFSSSLKGQASDLRQMTAALKSYRNEMGRVNRAYKAGGRRAITPPPPPPSPPLAPSRAPRQRGGYGGGGSLPAAVGGGIVGLQVGDMMTSAIVRGFQIGVGIMEKPFRYFANALGERINDEMSDLKAAGGIFSIAKRQKDPFVTTMDEAISFTQKNNLVLAKLASSLPGSTQDYIEVSKRISDTITRVVVKDMPAAIKEANRIRGTEEGAKFYGPQITATGKKGAQEAITTLLGELTKKTVLAGFGGRAGAGGAMGPYGLPGLTERLISQETVSMGQFQRYSAIFSDPQIMDALSRNIDKVNSTAKDSIERYQALNKLYDEVLPPELIEKFRRSVKGINEAIYSATFNPEVGLFGIGRKMQGLGKQLNDFGEYVDDTGKVVKDVNEAANANLSIFDMLRDIYAQTAQVLVPFIEYLPQIFDPLKNIGKVLKDARHYSAEFLKSFHSYREGLKTFAKTLGKEGEFEIMKTLDIRASLAAINNLFKQLGVFDSAKFKKIGKQLTDPKANIAKILEEMVQTFFSSKAAENVGKFLGTLVGTVLKQVGDVMKFATGIATASPFAKGFFNAFDAAGGKQAIKDIFSSLMTLIGRILTEIFLAAPFETSLLASLAVFGPAIAGALATSIIGAIPKVIGMALGGGAAGAGGAAAGAGGLVALLASPAGIAAAVASASIIAKATEGPVKELTRTLTKQASATNAASSSNLKKGPAKDADVGNFLQQNLWGIVGAELMHVVSDFVGGFNNLFAGLADFVVGLFSDPVKVKEGINKIFLGLWKLFTMVGHLIIGIGASLPAIVATLGNAIKNLFVGLGLLVMELLNKAKNFVASWRVDNPNVPNPFGPKPTGKPKSKAYGEPGVSFGSISKAISYEQKNKPPGSSLVVANSSEMVIPAAGGLGVQDLLSTLRLGFNTLVSTYITTQQKHDQLLHQINATLVSNQQQTNARLTKLETKFTTPGLGGLGGASIGGGVDAATPIAQRYGLQMTSGYRPGDPGYHGANRARDYSNGTGPTPQMMQFAQFMASSYGASLKELIYTPLGFSIKNGQKVAPYATAGHYNHVHVAFATGYGMPFTSAMEAMRFERAMVPGSVKVGSVTANSAEGFGGGQTTVNNNITIHQQPGQDAEELASIVAIKIGEAVAQARSSSVFV